MRRAVVTVVEPRERETVVLITFDDGENLANKAQFPNPSKICSLSTIQRTHGTRAYALAYTHASYSLMDTRAARRSHYIITLVLLFVSLKPGAISRYYFSRDPLLTRNNGAGTADVPRY